MTRYLSKNLSNDSFPKLNVTAFIDFSLRLSICVLPLSNLTSCSSANKEFTFESALSISSPLSMNSSVSKSIIGTMSVVYSVLTPPRSLIKSASYSMTTPLSKPTSEGSLIDKDWKLYLSDSSIVPNIKLESNSPSPLPLKNDFAFLNLSSSILLYSSTSTCISSKTFFTCGLSSNHDFHSLCFSLKSSTASIELYSVIGSHKSFTICGIFTCESGLSLLYCSIILCDPISMLPLPILVDNDLDMSVSFLPALPPLSANFPSSSLGCSSSTNASSAFLSGIKYFNGSTHNINWH